MLPLVASPRGSSNGIHVKVYSPVAVFLTERLRHHVALLLCILSWLPYVVFVFTVVARASMESIESIGIIDGKSTRQSDVLHNPGGPGKSVIHVPPKQFKRWPHQLV